MMVRMQAKHPTRIGHIDVKNVAEVCLLTCQRRANTNRLIGARAGSTSSLVSKLSARVIPVSMASQYPTGPSGLSTRDMPALLQAVPELLMVHQHVIFVIHLDRAGLQPATTMP